MKAVILFVAGVCVGALATLPGMAQQNRTVRGLNHVGIVVENYEQAMAFYTKTMGFPEAYTMRRPDGSPQLTYLQLSRDTFVELIPAGPGQQPGITHFGVEVGDLAAMIAHVRAQGGTVGAPGLTPARASFARMTDVGGAQIELMQFGPESMQRKAMDGWKP
jgi:catechol 2,3-dioxygenase-like lactoylglutathione lyase family enzyme